MSRAKHVDRVAELERQIGALLANGAGMRPGKNWRRTRGAFTGDHFMKQVFERGRKILRAATRLTHSQNVKRKSRP